MNATSRTERQILKARRDAAKARRKGLHTLASHARKAGLDADTASGVAGALRGKTKVCGIAGTSAVIYRPTISGAKMVAGARRYSRTEFLTLATAYAPRAPKYVAARALILTSA